MLAFVQGRDIEQLQSVHWHASSTCGRPAVEALTGQGTLWRQAFCHQVVIGDKGLPASGALAGT